MGGVLCIHAHTTAAAAAPLHIHNVHVISIRPSCRTALLQRLARLLAHAAELGRHSRRAALLLHVLYLTVGMLPCSRFSARSLPPRPLSSPCPSVCLCLCLTVEPFHPTPRTHAASVISGAALHSPPLNETRLSTANRTYVPHKATPPLTRSKATGVSRSHWLLRAVSTSHENAPSSQLETPGPVCLGDTAATLVPGMPGCLHPVQPVWSGPSPIPDSGIGHASLTSKSTSSSRPSPTTADLLFTSACPTSVAETLNGATAGGVEKRGRPPNRRALCRVKFISHCSENVVQPSFAHAETIDRAIT